MIDKKCCSVGKLAGLLLIIGGLNWGLIGAGKFAGSDWNVVMALLGTWPTIMWVVYILIGLAAVWSIFACASGKCCGGMCGTK